MPLRSLIAISSVGFLPLMQGLWMENPRILGNDTPNRSDGPRWPRSFVVDFLGLQDKPVARLVLYPRGSIDEVERQFHCGRQATCAELTLEEFTRLASRLGDEFDRIRKNDADAEKSEGFRFSLTVDSAGTRILECNRSHSARMLKLAVQAVPEGKARDELERRMVIASR